MSNNPDPIPQTDEEISILEKAFALSKCVPRQSGRNVWREKAGFAPNMMLPIETSGVLLKEDLVLYRAIDESIEYFIVQKDFKLSDDQKKLQVRKVGEEESLSVNPDRFLVHRGMIMTVPSHCIQS